MLFLELILSLSGKKYYFTESYGSCNAKKLAYSIVVRHSKNSKFFILCVINVLTI